ncbi:TLR13 [Mytilus coruscus]|uniref:TLR13 n=1 Tax=Mytilus coruscus TaxID=42192 RepID=A0A6J8ACV4_MYTCO|nr:TLR13 [Mytilus coruscus]
MAESVAIVPGLSNLNLNIAFENDMQLIADSVEGLNKRLTEEHIIVHNVLENMIAILKNKSSRGKIESREYLENILRRDPRNLNALADIEKLSRTLHRTTEADEYKSRLENILQGQTANDLRTKSICLMEQGYAILNEESANIEHISKNRLSESYRMLLSEHKKGTGRRKDYLQRCVYHNKQALSNLQLAIECKRQSELLTRRITALEKFEQAKGLFDVTIENIIWTFYIGVALNRKYDSIKDLSNEDGRDRFQEKKDVTLKATEIFWKISTNKGTTNQNFIIYQARSYALIGHILIRRKNFFLTSDKNYTFTSDQLFQLFMNNPISAFERAQVMNRSDTFILNRYGRALWNLSEQHRASKDKKDFLHRAQRLLSSSINQSSLNWFGYSTRMSVRKDLGHAYFGYNKSKARTFFELAVNDGYQCFISKGTPRSICQLVEICQFLAKFPDIREYGFKYVKEHQKRYLLNALDYLNFGLQQGGPTNYFLAYHMGTVLYDLDEIKSAVDWMKRAVSLSNTKSNIALKLACRYMIRRYMNEVDEQPNVVYLLKEFVFTMMKGKEKYEKIKDVYTFIFKHEREAFMRVIADIFKIPHILDGPRVKLITECVQTCTLLLTNDIENSDIFLEYIRAVPDLKLMDDIEPQLQEMSLSNSVPVGPVNKHSSEGFVYDFFVSHSHKDADWVLSRLVADLESAFTEDDVVLRGCIADRDFEPGKIIFENIENSLRKSSKIILVITNNFVNSYWCQFETNQALLESMESRKDCIIPLYLEACDIPDKLRHITYADFTNDDDYIFEIMKLKRALLPE